MHWLRSWESFVRIVETGSMAAAARRLDCTRAQISKQVADLEREFGVRLFERSTRKLALTPSGEVFHQHALRALDAISSTEIAVRNLGDTPCGLLRVSASITFGRMYIAPLLPRITAQYPELECELILTDQLVDLVDDPALLFPKWKPTWPTQLTPERPIMAQMRKSDIIIHQPFESFDAVLELLREAVNDPQVLAIKQTIYRTGSDSEIMSLLAEAVGRGKEVLAVLELKARFDEEANINWAEKLESLGVQVVYGVVGLKTHAKMLLITRREKRNNQLKRYAHLSTGNYNARSARLYTDLSHLTCDAAITEDMDAVFRHLSSHNRLPTLQQLVMAPFHLHSHMLERIGQAASAAAKGKDARIVLKMNALTDEVLIAALIDAGALGVQIDLIVRGACMLPAQVPGRTENIRVRSVIGRFLEHTRVFYFAWGTHEEVYLSSADWMHRNMLRRVELAWPVHHRKLRQRIIDECLADYLHDDRNAWQLQSDGRYQPPMRPSAGFGAQNMLMKNYGGAASARQ